MSDKPSVAEAIAAHAVALAELRRAEGYRHGELIEYRLAELAQASADVDAAIDRRIRRALRDVEIIG